VKQIGSSPSSEIDINCVQKISIGAFSISPGQVQLFDEKFTFLHPMSDFVDAQILEQHNQGATRDMICSLIHVEPNRVSCVLNFFWDHREWTRGIGKRTTQENNDACPRFHRHSHDSIDATIP
jgi:hypothetical protein